MPASLLATKLYLPPARPQLVPRPRLVARLQAGLNCPLTLVSAPAGFGKTTLVSEWRTGAGRGYPTAWLSLEEEENDPARFLTYLAAALATLRPGLGDAALAALQTAQPPPPQAVLTTLVNDLGALTRPFALILDDYHVITASPVHAALTFLLDHRPAPMRFVLLTRADPPLPLARLRARGELAEIRAADLRFTPDEATAFLNQAMALGLAAPDVAALTARTEGWIAALQLSALAVQGQAAPGRADFVAHFSGSQRYIADYLVEEVLDRQPEAVRAFMLRTSILDRLCGPLCDAVLAADEAPAAASLLRRLEQANLFLIPLDDERRWYRYHHLIADLLRRQLAASPAVDVPELHRRASQWYEQQGYVDQAIQHALAAKDWPRAAALIGPASQAALHAGEAAKLRGWLEALPPAEIAALPQLRVARGWASVLAGEFDEGERFLAEAEPLVQNDPALKVHWLAAQVWSARGRGELGRAVELAQQALAVAPPAPFGEDDARPRCLLMMSLSLAYWHLGMIQPAADAARAAVDLAERTGNWHARAMMLSRVALVQAAQGRLRQAERTYRQALEPQPQAPAWAGGGAPHHYLAALYYEWNDLDQAGQLAQLGLEYSQLTGHTEFHINSYRQLAYIHQARGEPGRALAMLEQAAQIARERHLPHILWGPLAATHVEIALAQGNLDEAADWLARVPGGYGGAFHYLKLPLENAKLALAQGDPGSAASQLDAADAVAAASGQRYAQIEIRILQALCAGSQAEALARLGEALAWAQPEGFVRVFIDQGPALAPLLRQAALHGLTPGYALQLLEALAGGSDSADRSSPLLIEPLSGRELEVLRLLAAGRSNREIAGELMLATGTVKKHLNNIFGKLNVSSRTQCVARARELHLV